MFVTPNIGIINYCDPTLKNHWDKYLEDASYILLSLYLFSDWLSYECQTEGVRRATSVVVPPCKF